MANPVFLTKAQFTGQVEIDFGNYDEFNQFAIEIEKKYAFELFGYEMGRDILNKLAALQLVYSGTDDYWTDLRLSNPYRAKNLEGFAAMVKYFFYFEFITRVQDKRTLSGDPQEAYVRSIQGERHIKNNHLVMVWNEGVRCWNEIVDYCGYQVDYESNTDYNRWPYTAEKETINTFGII